MAEDKMALVQLLQKSGDADLLRAVTEALLQILMEPISKGDRCRPTRAQRRAAQLPNGYRDCSLKPRLGMSLRIPKLHQGSYSPPFLKSRKTAEKALVSTCIN
jgi:transposase-like protein